MAMSMAQQLIAQSRGIPTSGAMLPPSSGAPPPPAYRPPLGGYGPTPMPGPPSQLTPMMQRLLRQRQGWGARYRGWGPGSVGGPTPMPSPQPLSMAQRLLMRSMQPASPDPYAGSNWEPGGITPAQFAQGQRGLSMMRQPSAFDQGGTATPRRSPQEILHQMLLGLTPRRVANMLPTYRDVTSSVVSGLGKPPEDFWSQVGAGAPRPFGSGVQNYGNY